MGRSDPRGYALALLKYNSIAVYIGTLYLFPIQRIQDVEAVSQEKSEDLRSGGCGTIIATGDHA